MVWPLNMFLTWAMPGAGPVRKRYRAAEAGLASAAGSGPAARQAPGCHLPGAFGHDGGLAAGLAGWPGAGRAGPGIATVTLTTTAAATAVTAAAVAARRIRRRRARLRRTWMSGMARAATGRTHAG